MTSKELIKSFIRSKKWSYIIGIIVLIMTSIVASLIPKILGIITDGLNSKDIQEGYIYKYVILMVAAAVAVFVLKFTWRYFLMGNSRGIEIYLRDKLFAHLQTLPVNFYNNHKTGDLIAHAINDIQAIRHVFGFGIVAIFDGMITSIISIYFMVKTINPILTLMALAPAPIVVIIMALLRKEIRNRFEDVQAAFAAISEKVQENLTGIRVIKAFAQEDEEAQDFIKYSQARVDTQMRLTRISAFLAPSAQICFALSHLLFITWGSELVIKGTISLGDYIAFNSYMLIIMGPIIKISRIIEVWQKGVASFRRLDRLFTTTTDIIDSGFADGDESPVSSVEIKNLNFTYPGAQEKALKNINLKIEPGKTLGILGTTGSGKTTLVNLLLRLYPVKRGHVFIDGKDINDIPIEVVREKIGYVPQDNFLFSTTIRGNIEFFRPVYSDDEIEDATKVSAVYENILSFPEGFDTVVGERGVTLSGGQKQRISIARAIIKDPSILILDDSLSAVDTKTEEEILGNIKELLGSRTGIIISHRISTVKHVDEIVFMNNGEIIERGTHEELLEAKGYYHNLYLTQTSHENMREEVVYGELAGT